MSPRYVPVKLRVSLSHDGYFRGTMLKVRVLKCFLRKSLSEDLVKEIDFDSLELSRESHTDPKLRTFYSDAVVHLNLKSKKPIAISMVLEHKSYSDKGDVLQLLYYSIGEQRNDFLKDTQKPLTPTIPVIISHTGKPSESKRQIHDLYDEDVPESISKRSIRCDYEVLNLNNLDESLFFDDIETLLVFRTMRDIHGDILGSIRGSLLYLADYAEGHTLGDSLKDTLIKTIEYVNQSDKISEGDMNDMITALREGPVKKRVLTLEDQLIEKGEKRGKAIGKAIGHSEAQHSIAKSLKKEGVSYRIISISTGLTEDEIIKL